MELSTLGIDPAEAQQRLDDYAGLVASERTAEDDAIAMGYRAAARGLPVISLSQTILAGGFHDNGMPRIAIVEATATTCFAHWRDSDLVFANRADWAANRGARVGSSSVRVPLPAESLPSWNRRSKHTYWSQASTIVPIVPPRYRPRLRNLRHRHVLWEVEQWTRVVPRDPALLRHIRGDLWAVLAVWDLTDLERAVLSQRA